MIASHEGFSASWSDVSGGTCVSVDQRPEAHLTLLDFLRRFAETDSSPKGSWKRAGSLCLDVLRAISLGGSSRDRFAQVNYRKKNRESRK